MTGTTARSVLGDLIAVVGAAGDLIVGSTIRSLAYLVGRTEPSESIGNDAREAAAEPPRRTGARVLLVEDNRDAADSLTMLLDLYGHHVRTFYDGSAALDAARAEAPDVMLVDIGLPGMDGYEVARRVRGDLQLRDVALIALTGYGREEDRREAFAAGFDHHLVKPVNPDRLGALIMELVGRRPPGTLAAR